LEWVNYSSCVKHFLEVDKKAQKKFPAKKGGADAKQDLSNRLKLEPVVKGHA
jgi:hypothetical protein